MRSLAHMREKDEALDDWERYTSLPLERLLRERDLKNMVLHALLDWGQDMEMVYHILQNDRKHLVVFRDEVKQILRNLSSGGE
jgi:hypothetical protein